MVSETTIPPRPEALPFGLYVFLAKKVGCAGEADALGKVAFRRLAQIPKTASGHVPQVVLDVLEGLSLSLVEKIAVVSGGVGGAYLGKPH